MINTKITLISYQNIMIKDQNTKTRIKTKVKSKNQQDQLQDYSVCLEISRDGGDA